MDQLNQDVDRPGSDGLVFPLSLIQQMKNHVAQTAPEEACGLVAGKDLVAVMAIPIRNMLRSPFRFRMDPAEQLRAFNLIDELNLELQAIYHSHPNGPEVPSNTDVAESYYPEALSVIWSGQTGEWNFRCFFIRDGQVREMVPKIRTVDSNQ